MPSLPPPRTIAGWIAPLALYVLLFPVLTMLAVYVGSGLLNISFSTLSAVTVLLSVLYWGGRFGDADTTAGAAGSANEALPLQATARNHTLAGRSRFNQLTSTANFGVSPYTLYFFGLLVASILAYMGVVP